jgi:hypothetical protein
MREIYVSTDIETDGPIPGVNSMLSFASVAYRADKTRVSTFFANLELLPGAVGDDKTMDWWKTMPEAWAACREDLKAPQIAMQEYAAWLKSLPGDPVFVAYPLGFDFTFVYWYLIRFTGDSPFKHNGIDIRTYAMAVIKKTYKQSGKEDMPERWLEAPPPHTHQALDDAIEQGELFCNMLIENTRR